MECIFLRRGPAHLPRRFLAPGALPGPGQARTRSPRSWPLSCRPPQQYENVKFPTVPRPTRRPRWCRSSGGRSGRLAGTVMAASRGVETASTAPPRAGSGAPAGGGRRSLARRRPVPCLRHVFPARSRPARSSSRRSVTPSGSFSFADDAAASTSPDPWSAFETTIKLSLITAVLGGAARPARRPVDAAGRGPRLDPAGAHDVRRGRVELRRRPARLRLHRDPRQHGGRSRCWFDHLGLHLYGHGFTIYGLTRAVPDLCVLPVPADDPDHPPGPGGDPAGVARGGRRASAPRPAVLAPGRACRLLLPSLLGAVVLLFGNAFSAYATPYALSSGYINIVPVLIGESVNGISPRTRSSGARWRSG